jgi:hypothetical protein
MLSGIGQKALDFADDLQKVLGAAQATAAAWLEERRMVRQQLETIRDTAGQILRQLGIEAESAPAAAPAARVRVRRRAARSQAVEAAAPVRKRGGGRGRRFSAETRKKMSLAQQRRWAAFRGEKPAGE